MFECGRSKEAINIGNGISRVDYSPAIGDLESNWKDILSVALDQATKPFFKMAGADGVFPFQSFDTLSDFPNDEDTYPQLCIIETSMPCSNLFVTPRALSKLGNDICIKQIAHRLSKIDLAFRRMTTLGQPVFFDVWLCDEIRFE